MAIKKEEQQVFKPHDLELLKPLLGIQLSCVPVLQKHTVLSSVALPNQFWLQELEVQHC